MTLRDMTHGPGLLPINLGPAKLQISHHTLVHYYDLLPIRTQIENLNKNYENLYRTIIDQKGHPSVNNYDGLFRNFYRSVRDKLNNINPSYDTRKKRGLINGLGSVIKFLTGNMDAEDAVRINKITSHLQKNQHTLQEQINNQYSINNNILMQFNSTIKNIQYNENQLKDKILELGNYIQNTTKIINDLEIKDIFNQLIITYNIILNVLSEIENSVTFCAVGVLHPSIIKVHDLISELQKLVPFYKDQMPLPVNIQNILQYQSLMKVHCQHSTDRITYFLTIPLEYPTQFEMYYLEPLPTQIQDEYFTIIPNFKYLLKYQNIIKPLSDICDTGSIYHCPSKLITTGNSTCENNAIQGNSTDGCQFTKINPKGDHFHVIPYLNQYLGWFMENTKLEIHCPREKKILQPKGVFLMEIPDDCKVKINGEEIRQLQPTKNTPIITDFKIPNEKLAIQQSNMSIELRGLSLNQINQNHLSPIKFNDDEDNDIALTPSIWTMLLYGIIISSIIIFLTKTYILHKKRMQESQPSANIQEGPMNHLRLPSDASF